MRASTVTTALALAWGALAACAQDVSTQPAKAVTPGQSDAPTPLAIASGQFPVPPPAVPNLEMLAGTPGEPIGKRDVSNFQEPQLGQVKSNLMARYEVHADRVPEFRVRDIYNRNGIAEFSMRAHPGLILGDFFGSNRGEAYEMYLEDERLGNIAGLVDTALAITVGGDKAEGDAILGEVRRAYLRDERSDPLQSWEDAPKTRAGEPVIVDLELMQVNWLTVKF
jgi:hypothetical protein